MRTQLKVLSILVLLVAICSNVFAQKKKYKDAPDETIILMIGEKHPDFNESQFPHLKFYYAKDLKYEIKEGDVVVGVSVLKGAAKKNEIVTYTGEPEFISKWANSGKDGMRIFEKGGLAYLIDKNGTVVFQSGYSWGPEDDYNETPNIINKLCTYQKKPLKGFLTNHITKGKLGKVDPKKTYPEGGNPNWDFIYDKKNKNGFIGMKFPGNFTVYTPDGTAMSFNDVIKDKPSLVFTYMWSTHKEWSDSEAEKRRGNLVPKLISDAASQDNHLLWLIESKLYNYSKPKK